MPRCYLLANCVGSALDADSNNISLFHVLEQAQAVAPIPEKPVLPGETHVYFQLSPEDYGMAFELRILALTMGGEEVLFASEPLPWSSDKPRMRLRMRGIGMPSRAGLYEYRVEWRRIGSESWHREAASFPLEMTVVEPLAHTP